MAVYVDELFRMESRDPQAHRVGQRTNHLWCHMWADDVVELHEFAARLSLRREWAQLRSGFPHYDLVPAKRSHAISLGARQVNIMDWLRAKKFWDDFIG